MLRFVKFKKINRLSWREQEQKKNWSQSRLRFQFKAVGLDFFFFLFGFLRKAFENLMKAIDLFLGNCM